MHSPTSAWITRWPVDSGTSVACQTEPAVSVEREQGFLPSLATPARCRRVILDATGGPSDSATWPTWTSSTTAASLATSGIVRHTRPLNCMADVGLVRSLPRGCWRIYWPRTHAAPADRRASANEKTPLKLYQITILTTKQLHYPELSYHGRVAGNPVPLRITAWTCRDSNCHARHRQQTLGGAWRAFSGAAISHAVGGEGVLSPRALHGASGNAMAQQDNDTSARSVTRHVTRPRTIKLRTVLDILHHKAHPENTGDGSAHIASPRIAHGRLSAPPASAARGGRRSARAGGARLRAPWRCVEGPDRQVL